MTAIDRDRLADWRRLHRDACGTWEVGRGRFETETNGLYIAQILDHLPTLLNQIDQAEAERDEWRQTAQDEHAAALDLIGVVKVRDRRIEDVRNVLDKAHDEFEQPDEDAIRRALDQKV